MKNLLRFEFRKLFKQPSTYVCLGIAMVLAFLSVYSIYSLYKLFLENNPGATGFSMWMGSDVVLSGKGMLLTTLGSDNVTLVLAIFIALFICGDYKWKTDKNIIGRGFGRSSWHGSRLAAVVCGSLIICLGALVVAYVAGSLFWQPGGALTGKEIGRLLLQLFIALAYVTLFFFFSTLIRNTGGAIAINIFFPIFIALVLTILDLAVFKEDNKLSQYWLSQCMTTAANPLAYSGDLGRCWFLAGGYILVFTGLSFWINSKRDV